MSRYRVTNESDIQGSETQTVWNGTDLSFEQAHDLAARCEAERFVKDGVNHHDDCYVVQPSSSSQQTE